MQSLLAGNLPPELQLDLLEAAENSKAPEVAQALKTFESRRDKNDALSAYTETLHGGDPVKGRRIFLEKGNTACLRCHKIGTEAVVAGPDLAGIGAKKDRRYLLESILKPSAQIAPGFESVILTMKDGDTITGTLKKETEAALHVEVADEGVTEVSKAEIAERRKTLSAMPEGLEQMLDKRELRDVIEFLASLKDEKQVINPTRPADPSQPRPEEEE
jgi:quinoprotein glucose dehydrogenase